MTLDLPATTRVLELKDTIVESTQAAHLGVGSSRDIELRCMDKLLSDDGLMQESAAENGRALHLTLTARREALPLDHIPTTSTSPLCCEISTILPASVRSVSEPAAAMELRGWADQPIGVDVGYEPESRRLSLRVHGSLMPCQRYCVIIRGNAVEPEHSDAAWSFASEPLQPVRVVLALTDTPFSRRLVTLQRQTHSLRAELLGAARGCFEPTRDFDFHMEGASAALSDAEIGLLQDGALVLCQPRISAADGGDGRVVHDEVEELNHDAYCAAHYVNEEAGFYAVAGKMSAEEETAALLAVVEAFADENAPTDPAACERPRTPDEPAPKRSRPKADGLGAESAIDTTGVVPPELLERRWGTPREPSCFSAAKLRGDAVDAAEAAALLAAWHRSGFAVITLEPEVLALVERLYDTWEAFCALPLESKEESMAPRERYLGYHHRPHFHKELFQLRGCARAHQAWPQHEHGRAAQAAAEAAFDALASLAADLLRLVCTHIGVADPDQLLEARLNTHNSDELSQSNLTCFRYSVALGAASSSSSVVRCVHCPYHSDIGLVTVIPCGRGAPGLHVHDFTEGAQGWVDIEESMPPNSAVILGGESLFRLSNEWLLPGIHEVSHIVGERISCPMQLLARADALLSSAGQHTEVVGALKPRCTKPVFARRFVEELSAQRVSSNFPREHGA